MQAPRQEPPTYRQQYDKHDGCDDGQPATSCNQHFRVAGMHRLVPVSHGTPLFLLMLHITLNVQDYLMAPYAIRQDARFLYRI